MLMPQTERAREDFKGQRLPVTPCDSLGLFSFLITTDICTHTYIPNLQTEYIYGNQTERNRLMFQRLNRAICLDIRKLYVEPANVQLGLQLSIVSNCIARHSRAQTGNGRTSNLSKPESKQENRKFMLIFGYTVSSQQPGTFDLLTQKHQISKDVFRVKIP